MAWRASFSGPNAMNGAHTVAEWADAADWLRAMLDCVMPPRGYVEAVQTLRGTQPGNRFLAKCGDFWFKIEAERVA